MKFLAGEVICRNSLFFDLLHFLGWILVQPIVADAKLEKADQSLVFAAGRIQAIAPDGTKLDQIRGCELFQQGEANVFRPRQQLHFKERLALIRA